MKVYKQHSMLKMNVLSILLCKCCKFFGELNRIKDLVIGKLLENRLFTMTRMSQMHETF